MNICITGINGFVGKYLSDYLSKKNSIISYNFKSITNNLNDINVLIHLAGKAHDTMNGISEEYYITNTELTKDWTTVNHNGVNIVGNSALASSMPSDASKLYGKNVLNFLQLIIITKVQIKN